MQKESEQKGEKRLAAFYENLLFLSGLRRLRQDLVNSISRLDGGRSTQLSYGASSAALLILLALLIRVPVPVLHSFPARVLPLHQFGLPDYEIEPPIFPATTTLVAESGIPGENRHPGQDSSFSRVQGTKLWRVLAYLLEQALARG